MVKLISTGIKGLDEVLGGGFPTANTILVSGTTGTGKTVFSMQFLYEGLKNNETGVFVTLEERPHEIMKEMETFGWKVENNKNLLIIDGASPKVGLPVESKYYLRKEFSIGELLEKIYEVVKRNDAKRLVIDSISALALRLHNETEIRQGIEMIANLLSELGCTTLITSEVKEGDSMISRFGVEEFAVRGVVCLFLEERGGSLERSLLIRKIRGMKHSMRKYPFQIAEDGITILPEGRY